MRIISGSARGTKLYTLEGITTRPTLDRIKESLFNIIQNRIYDSTVLDLFSGSGALGLECLSRGAKNCVFCDKSNKASNIIKKNIEKTKFTSNAELYTTDFKICLNKVKQDNKQFDIIFLDPPYDTNLICLATQEIIELNLLNKDGIIVAETDNEEEIIEKLKKITVNISEIRKYGRVKLLFIKQ